MIARAFGRDRIWLLICAVLPDPLAPRLRVVALVPTLRLVVPALVNKLAVAADDWISLATVTSWLAFKVTPTVPPVLRKIDPAVPEVTEPVSSETLPDPPEVVPPAPEVRAIDPPVAPVPEAAPPVIETAPPLLLAVAPEAAPPVIETNPPVPVVVAAPPFRTRFLPLLVEVGALGAMVRLVPAAVERVVMSGVAPPLRASTPVPPFRVAFEPFKVSCPPVLPIETPVLALVPRDRVPEAGSMLAPAPRLRAVSELAVKVPELVKVVRFDPPKLVAVGRAIAKLLRVRVPVPD